MADSSIDDEWEDLIGDVSGPMPIGDASPTPNKTVRVPATKTQVASPVGDSDDANAGADAVNKVVLAPMVPTVGGTQRAAIVTPRARPKHSAAASVPTPRRRGAVAGPVPTVGSTDKSTVRVSAPAKLPEAGVPVAIDESDRAVDGGDDADLDVDLDLDEEDEDLDVDVDIDASDEAEQARRRTASVVVVPRSTADTIPYRSRPIVTKPAVTTKPPAGTPLPSGRHATRRLVVRPPPTAGNASGPAEGHDDGTLPAVPDFAGARESNPMAVETVSTPEASEDIRVSPVPDFDPSADINLDSVRAPSAPVAAQPEIDHSEDISLEPIPLGDSELLSVTPATVPRRQPIPTVPEAIVEPEPVPQSQDAADDTDLAAASSPRGYVPQMAPSMAADPGARAIVPWALGCAALLALGVLGWIAVSDEKASDPVAAAAVASKAPSKPAATPVAAATPSSTPTDTPPVAGSDATDAQPDDDEVPSDADGALHDKADVAHVAAVPAPDDDEPIAEPVADVEADVETDAGKEAPPRPSTVDPDASARYAQAATQYNDDGSAAALETMVNAACAMDDGVRARSAFRKLTGKDVRSRVMVSCRERSIDLAAPGDGPTPAELLRAAERALEAGDLSKAADLARTSNRSERSQAAILLSARVACAAGKLEKVASLRRHLKRAARRTLAEHCPASADDG